LYGGEWYKANADVSLYNPTDAKNNWDKLDKANGPILKTEGFAEDKTAEYMNLSNDDYWTKTHFGSLIGKTIGVDYQRGDNIYYQGKHYVYTSHLSSSDQVFTAGSGESGVTAFEQLLLQGAVTELKMYVDTVGGGGTSDLAHGVYYRPNQDLEFIDRIPDSGLVRTNSIERRTDPNLGADEIYNSSDDLFYSGLNPGNDNIYGTMDDYYSTTAFSDVAKGGGHVDSDADNNKDLLDTSNSLGDFSVADFVDYIQTIANFRAVNGGTLTRLDFSTRLLEENQVNLEAAHGRIMDTDMAKEASRMAQQSVLMQAGAAMVSQANQMNQIVLQLLQ
jgi:flagellin